jgi:VWFA-related protein
MMRASVRIASGLLAASVAVATASPQAPVFRSRVDMVTVDVSVIDGSSKPVTGLTARDFSIVADKRPRPVVSAEYVAAAQPRPRPGLSGADVASLPAPTSNSQPTAGRTFLFVIDVEQIAQGGSRSAIKALSAYLDRLNPADRVGLISLPYHIPRVDVTTDRRPLVAALNTIVGASTRNQDMVMTVGEAGAIELLDEDALNQYLERINAHCTDALPGLPGLDDDPTLSCIQRFQPAAAKVMDAERQHTHYLFTTLRELAEAMASIDGPKAMVLVSQGVVNDRFTLDEQRLFARAAQRALVTLFAINLDGPLPDVISKYNMISAHIRDHQVLLDGMTRLAIAGRGDVYMVSGTPERALARIDAEMAGYYLLSFERDAKDRTGEREGIEVKVNWPSARVRARTEFTLDPPFGSQTPRLPGDPDAAVAELLRWPLPFTDLGVDVDTYTAPTPNGTSALRTVIAASVASGGQPVTAVGYEVTDESGKVVAGGLEPNDSGGRGKGTGKPIDTPSLAADRKLYAAGFSIPPGQYRLKLAVVDATGRRGSIDHSFEVRASRAGALRLSDVFLGELGASGFVPNPSIAVNAAALPVRVELCGDTPEAFAGSSVILELARPGAPAFAQTPLSVTSMADARRRVASATLALAPLPAGDYLVTAVLTTADGASTRNSHLFTKR